MHILCVPNPLVALICHISPSQTLGFIKITHCTGENALLENQQPKMNLRELHFNNHLTWFWCGLSNWNTLENFWQETDAGPFRITVCSLLSGVTGSPLKLFLSMEAEVGNSSFPAHGLSIKHPPRSLIIFPNTVFSSLSPESWRLSLFTLSHEVSEIVDGTHEVQDKIWLS